MTFEVGPDGEAISMTHDQAELLPTVLERHPLREEWQDCVVPPWG